MNWFIKFILSSIGQKLIVSLTGLFLISFLLIHMLGNLQLLMSDEGRAFNLYAKFMTSNPLIKVTSYGLYLFILLHAFQGWLIWSKNRKAIGKQRYAVQKTRTTGTPAKLAKNMGWIGTIIFIFIVIHMYKFWYQMHWGNIPMVDYDGVKVKNLYSLAVTIYSNSFYVIFYVVSMGVVAAHLKHGFHSAFQTLGLNHLKYSPFIKLLGNAYAIIIPFGFAIIPIYMFVKNTTEFLN